MKSVRNSSILVSFHHYTRDPSQRITAIIANIITVHIHRKSQRIQRQSNKIDVLRRFHETKKQIRKSSQPL
jgi:hypothetical protein